jgi:hypothetical protein
MRRPILLAALALSMSGCVRANPNEPSNRGASKGTDSSGPNFAGNWNGTYVITDCRQGLDVGRANVCGALGNSGQYHFVITQTNGSVTVVPMVGPVQFPNRIAKVSTDGGVGFSASATSDDFNVVVEVSLGMTSDGLAGTINEIWSSSSMNGKATVNGRISTAVRTNSAP